MGAGVENLSDLSRPMNLGHRAHHDPAALNPGFEFPRYLYHAKKPPIMVYSAQEERDLGTEWSRTYIHQEYPKVKHHWSGKTITVKSAEEDAALGGGWANRTTEFDKYRDARCIRKERCDPGKWVNEWSVVGLSQEHRRKIKAQLLRADSSFERSLDSDPDAGALASMRQAFDGIAQVLFDPGILTEEILQNDLSQLVWDSAIAGGWWRYASEKPQDIFPEQLGHYWVWRDDKRDWSALFRAEVRDWEAKLLEDRRPETPGVLSPIAPIERPPLTATPREAAGGGERPARAPRPRSSSASNSDFASNAQRTAAIEAYKKSWQCSEAALARTARVNPADLSKWKKGLLPEGSDKKARIENVLMNNLAPTPCIKRRSEP